MAISSDAIAEALASGETDRVNRAIDRLDALTVVERYRLYDDLFDACRPVFERDDGYVRQSVVRALRESYPRLELRIGGGTDDVVDGITLADAAEQRERYVAFLLEALDDEDGRVRKAAADGFDLLAVGLGVAELDREQERILEELDALADSQPVEKRKHTVHARDAMARLGVSDLISEALFGDEIE